MSWEDEFLPVDEDARRRFEQAIKRGEAPEIAPHLPASDNELFLGTLEELVMIDMNIRWLKPARERKPRPVESYVLDHPALASDASLLRLVVEELRLRIRCGNIPQADELQERFPQFASAGEIQRLLDETTPRFQSAFASSKTSRYSIQRTHATGGMGVVYAAIDDRFGREVALKHMRPGLDSEVDKQRFMNEARLAGRLTHPGVVPIYDIGELDDGSPYYTMKLVEGDTLEELIRRHHADPTEQSLRQLLRVVVSVANTVAFAHDRNVIHRDLKPANIVVGNFGESIVLDWGVAKVATTKGDETTDNPTDNPADNPTEAPAWPEDSNARLTEAGAVLGTPAYMSPEQATGKQVVDARTDVYALGAILFHIVGGRPPVLTWDDFHQQKDGAAPSSPQQFSAQCPPALDAICQRAMTSDASHRYASAKEFAKEIDRYLADEPVLAFSEPWSAKLGRWARRRITTLVVMGAVAALLGVLIAAAAFVAQARTAEQARALAVQRTVIENEHATALSEIREGRFESGVANLNEALAACRAEPSLEALRQQLEDDLEQARRLVRFHQMADRAESYAWSERGDDIVILLQEALDTLHVFDHADWWRRMTSLELTPNVEDDLRRLVYRELGMLIGVRLIRGAMEVETYEQFIQGGNRAATLEFEAARPAIHAAKRFRPALGLVFAEAVCDQQSRVLPPVRFIPVLQALARVMDPTQMMGAADRYFIGLALVYYVRTKDRPDEHHIVGIANEVVKFLGNAIRLDIAPEVALRHLNRSGAEEPGRYWTALAHAWSAQHVGDYSNSIAILTRAMLIKPRDPTAYLERSHQFHLMALAKDSRDEKTRHTRLALLDIVRAERLAPANADVQSSKARYLAESLGLSQGDQDQGVTTEDEKLGQSDRAKWHAAATASLRSVLLSAPDEQFVFTPALQLKRRNRLETAAVFADAHIRHLPELPDGWLIKAYAAWRLQRSEDAKAALEEVLHRDPHSSGAALLQGEMSLAQAEWRNAQGHFEAAFTLDEEDYLARRGLAIAAHQLGDCQGALKWLDEMASFDEPTFDIGQFNEWQQRDYLQWVAKASIGAGDSELAICAVQQIVDVRPSDDCDEILAIDGLDARLKSTLQGHLKRDWIRGISKAKPDMSGSHAALLNGGFELSLDRYWESTPDRPLPWWNVGGCRSTAVASAQASHTGRYALRIQHRSRGQDGAYGILHQNIPTEHQAIYEVRVWAMPQQLKDKAVRIRVRIDGVPRDIIQIEGGDSDWQEYSGRFEAKGDATQLEIVSMDQGVCWLDDMTVAAQPPGR